MLSPNTLLQHGRYRIIRRIGSDGINALYEAQDQQVNIKVALKESLMDMPHVRQAVEREGERLRRLRHPALPKLFDCFIEGNRQYMVMEYIEGQNLAKSLVMQARPFALQDVLRWADALLDALSYLHKQQPPLIHRHIKPTNLKLTPNGQIILLDFALPKGALLIKHADPDSLHGYSFGYAPPEQLAGIMSDERSDLYGLAATLYHLLTAQMPLDARIRQKAAQDGTPDPLIPINEINPEVPFHVTQVLTHALALKATDRPANAAAMRTLLRLNMTSPPVKTKPKENKPPLLVAPSRPNGSKWRRWLPIAIAILLWIMIISGLITSFMVDPIPPDATPTTVIEPDDTTR